MLAAECPQAAHTVARDTLVIDTDLTLAFHSYTDAYIFKVEHTPKAISCHSALPVLAARSLALSNLSPL